MGRFEGAGERTSRGREAWLRGDMGMFIACADIACDRGDMGIDIAGAMACERGDVGIGAA